MSSIPVRAPYIEPTKLGHKFHTTVDVLRLDEVHPVVSGNKLFKLQGYLEEAKVQGRKTLVTMGGAYSNHILAVAAAAQLEGFHSLGLTRGEKPTPLSPTLTDAVALHMELRFIARHLYREKDMRQMLSPADKSNDHYFIPEGGYGRTGARGAATIMDIPCARDYDGIIAAVGSGTTLAGLVLGGADHQTITGIPVLKGAHSLEAEIRNLLPPERHEKFSLIEGYHFGGYAKHTPLLLDFMNQLYLETGVPTDFVYTGKLFYAVNDLLAKGFWPAGSRLLVVHSGGLQGNRSLAKGTLIF